MNTEQAGNLREEIIALLLKELKGSTRRNHSFTVVHGLRTFGVTIAGRFSTMNGVSVRVEGDTDKRSTLRDTRAPWFGAKDVVNAGFKLKRLLEQLEELECRIATKEASQKAATEQKQAEFKKLMDSLDAAGIVYAATGSLSYGGSISIETPFGKLTMGNRFTGTGFITELECRNSTVEQFITMAKLLGGQKTL